MGHLAGKAAAASQSSHYGETSPETQGTKGKKTTTHKPILNVNQLLNSCDCSVLLGRILLLTLNNNVADLHRCQNLDAD